MSDIKLQCACGQVQGRAINVTPKNGNHVACSCSDCQDFAHYLQKASDNNGPTVLDEFGGTELYQTSQSQIKIDQGADQLRCLKLKPKGLTRWYTDCCKTPVGNAINGSLPFFGIVHNFMGDTQTRDEMLGPVKAYCQAQHALKPPTHPNTAEKFPLPVTLSIVTKMLGWKVRGMNKPSPFYTDDLTPVSKPDLING